jgi:hypothetical protein
MASSAFAGRRLRGGERLVDRERGRDRHAPPHELGDEVTGRRASHVEREDRSLHGVARRALVGLLVRDEVTRRHEAVLDIIDA